MGAITMLCDYTGYQVSSWAELLTSHSGYVVDRCPLNLEDRGSIPPKVVTITAVSDGEAIQPSFLGGKL